MEVTVNDTTLMDIREAVGHLTGARDAAVSLENRFKDLLRRKDALVR